MSLNQTISHGGNGVLLLALVSLVRPSEKRVQRPAAPPPQTGCPPLAMALWSETRALKSTALPALSSARTRKDLFTVLILGDGWGVANYW